MPAEFFLKLRYKANISSFTSLFNIVPNKTKQKCKTKSYVARYKEEKLSLQRYDYINEKSKHQQKSYQTSILI